MSKIHRVVLLVVDDYDIGAADIKSVIENVRYPNHCIAPTVMHVDTREVEWSDEHPLNNTQTQAAAFDELFATESRLRAALREACDGWENQYARDPEGNPRPTIDRLWAIANTEEP